MQRTQQLQQQQNHKKITCDFSKSAPNLKYSGIRKNKQIED
jgi:hypothetical protein